MNTLKAIELKRRGIAAIEEALAFGPVHILKHDRPTAVVVSEAEYQLLIRKKAGRKNLAALDWIRDYQPTGKRTKADIDKQISEERSAWE